MANCLGAFYSNRRYESAAATWPEFSAFVHRKCLNFFSPKERLNDLFALMFVRREKVPIHFLTDQNWTEEQVVLLERGGAGSFKHAVGSIALGFLPRNVITYSALISACEKGEQWQRALCLAKTS